MVLGGFGTIFEGLKFSISTTIMGDHYGFGGGNFRPPKIVPKTQNHTSNYFIRPSDFFSVHLNYSGAFRTFPAEISKGWGHIDTPQTAPNFGTQNLIHQ